MKTTTEPTEASFTLLTQVVELWNNEVAQLLKQHTLTQTEFAMLASVYQLSTQNKNTTQVSVCNYGGIKQMNASILLRKLQARKFITRTEHPIDTRAKTVHLTELGGQTTTKILDELDKLNYHFFQLSEETKKVFINKLQSLRDNNSN